MRSLNILLVEDHKATKDTLAKMLTRRGHFVFGVGTVREALECAQHSKFHLIISDIGLPDGDGWTLLKELRCVLPLAKAIALTGFGYPADYDKSVDAGFSLHLTKPVEIEQLERAIEKLFEVDSARSRKGGLKDPSEELVSDES